MILQDVLGWFDKNPYFKPKGRAICYLYGTYNGRNKYEMSPTFIHFDGEPFGEFSMGDFSARIYDGGEDRIQLKVDVYLNSYCDWDTCFEGIIPNIEFLDTLFYECFKIPRA